MASEASQLSQESLFSLELVVDRVCLPKLTCRFPAVAFRLFNFPALMIYHVEPELAVTIKKKIISDVGYTPPPQLHELQDKDGNFSIKKGKSCLFKTSPNKLQALLSTTPLYVMLIDTYPETPKLLGNCTVPLDAVMDDVYEDVCKMGVSVPSVHCDKGTFRLYNLMSSDIGNITLGFRLLSLGAGLLAHIPETSIAKVPEGHSFAEATSNNVAGDLQITDDGTLVQDIETHDKNLQVALNEAKPQKEDIYVQTQKFSSDSIGTQTKRMGKKSKMVNSEAKRDEDNIFITNTICPPPLFYNSKAPEKSMSSMDFFPVKQESQVKLESEYFSSDDDTIRPEDKFSDSDAEVTTEIKIEHQDDYAKTIRPKATSAYESQNQMLGKMQMPTNGLPILNALVKEIMSLQGLPMETVQQPLSPESRKNISSQLFQALREEKGKKDLTNQMATPRHTLQNTELASSPGRKTPRECTLQHRQEVPKGKSWIRKVPASNGVRKTNLTPGLTNTQRLRLAKANPELLQSLEKQEKDRKAKWRASRPVNQGMTAAETNETMTVRQKTNDPFAIPSLDLGGSEDMSHHKRPVPTPRQLMAREKQVPVVTPRTPKLRSADGIPPSREAKPASLQLKSPSREKVFLLPRDENEEQQLVSARTTSSHSSRTQSSRSRIEVHVPSVSTYSKESDSAASSHDFDSGNNKFGETRVLMESQYQRSETPGHDYEYSEDFDDVVYTGRTKDTDQDRDRTVDEGLDPGEMLGLRMVVDKFSDDDEGDKQSTTSFHSAKSQYSSEEPKQTSNLKLQLQTSVPNPASSARSPSVMSHGLTHLDSTREPLTINSTTTEVTESYDTGDLIAQPRPSPRRKPPRARLQSMNTESVSSYVPSDEEDNLLQLRPGSPPTGVAASKFMKDLKIDPSAKPGYTWSGV